MFVILSNAKNLAKYVEQSQREILHCVQDDRNLWVNYYIISKTKFITTEKLR